MLSRLIEGYRRRSTRLHDFQGNRLPWIELRDLVPSVCATGMRKASIQWWSSLWLSPKIRSLHVPFGRVDVRSSDFAKLDDQILVETFLDHWQVP